MTVTFTFLDWFWVVMFSLLMIGSGVLFYRLGKRSESDFFLAGRGLPWWLPASSVYATHTATDTPMWITGVIYQHGLVGIWYTFFSAWAAISAFVSTRIFRRSLAYTQAEWNVLRFSGLGSELIRGWMAGWQVFMNMFVLGWVGIAMGKVCLFLFGWPTWIGLVSFSAVCAIYVLAAGYWGVIMADFQQGIIAFLVIMIVSFYGIYIAGGPTGIVEKLVASLALAFAFIVMASVFAPAPSSADHDDNLVHRPDHPNSTDPHKGLFSLGSLEGEKYHIHIYSTELGPRYSVYDANDGSELSVLITAEKVAEWYPKAPLPDMDFDSPRQLMLVEPEPDIFNP